MKFGNELPQGDARILFNRFSEFKATLPEEVQSLLPNAVCFTVSEVQEYLDKVSEMFEERSIPEDQRCIALMPGKYGDDAPKEHLRNKVTTVFVASKTESNDNGQVALIENCVLNEETEIEDVSYNVGSLNP